MLRLMDHVSATARKRFIDPFDWQGYKMETEAELSFLATRLEELGLQVHQVVLEVRSAELIIDFAHAHDVDLIVVALADHDTGDLTNQFVKHTDIPVLITRADGLVRTDPASLTYRRILVPLDGSQRAECVLSLAETLAEGCGAELIVAHVVRRPEIPRRAPLSQEDADLANRLVGRNQQEGQRYLETITSQIKTLVHHRLLVDDNVADALHDLVKEEAIDLVVVSAHGYSGRPRWPYGSIAGSFIAFGDRPVMVVQDLPDTESRGHESDMPVRQAGDR